MSEAPQQPDYHLQNPRESSHQAPSVLPSVKNIQGVPYIPFNPEDYGLAADFTLTKYGDTRDKGVKPNHHELQALLSSLMDEERVKVNAPLKILSEETTIIKLAGTNFLLLESTNFQPPVVNEPYYLGKIAFFSVMSGIFALGIVECTTHRMILSVSNQVKQRERNIVIPMITQGYLDAAKEANVSIQGIRVTSSPAFLIGGTATSIILSDQLMIRDCAQPGDVLVLTKPLGTSIALKLTQWMEVLEKRTVILQTMTEADVYTAKYRALDHMLRSNQIAAIAMRKCRGTTVDLDTEGRSCDTPEAEGSSGRDLSSSCSNHDDDPYEYDEELPTAQEDIYEGPTNGSPKDDNHQASGASSSGVTPCWGCRGCTPGTPLFLLGSPAEAPCTCVSFLCSNRVSQMTKTYNDIEAVTRLLEEKEKDLELTARIGKELLTHNQKLESTVNSLEAELKSANEKITQLSHEILKKTELIQILTNDVDESGSETGTPTGLRGINLEFMQRRILSLEDENKQLKTEFTRLVKDADDCEAQEAKLVADIASQLANANMEVDGIAEELGRQKEENRLQHEQIVSLTAKLSETELRLAKLLTEHDEIGETLMITRENQNALAAELADFKEKYAEISHLLEVAQDELRKQRKRGLPTVRGGSLFPSMGAAPQPDSIASELESSLYSEFSLDSGIVADRTPTYKKVFETVRSASRVSHSQDANQFPRIGSMTTSTLSSGSSGPRMSCGPIRGHLDSTGHSDSEGSLVTDNEEYPGPHPTGVPGAPGAADLEAALRRLTPAEVIARRACLSTGTGYNFDYDGGIIHSPPTFLPFGCRTPDSIMSTGSSGNLSGFSGNTAGWRLPEKLQIVKPMEGSQTLHHWSQLATPTLGGLLEERPGVKTRGGRGLEDLGLETFTLADLEEDEEYANPGKLFQDTGSVYTFTNSTVMHPEDPTNVTSSVIGSRVATAPSSAMNSGMSTPRGLSRRNSTSTFSTTLGLAKMLNERGIKAVTPSCVATPSSERNFTPTATPYNSPDGTPPPSRPMSPVNSSPMGFGLFSSGAELLKRTFGSEPSPPVGQTKRKRKPALSRSEKKALTGIRLVEKLERMGIDTIMATAGGSSVSPLALQGALCTRRSVDSPMAQLTFLKGSMSSEKLGSTGSMISSSSSDSVSSTGDKIKGKDEGESSKRPTSGGRSQGGRRRGGGTTRPDLGQVTSAVSTPVTKESAAQSTFGALSSLLFGRKGGLL